MRCLHESSLHEFNSFLTLTYDDANLPDHGNLVYRDFQLFFKRLRKAGVKARFFMCGEYGEEEKRPHYHAIIFGFDPVDKVYYRKTGAGEIIYTSASLDAMWRKGTVFVGAVTFESAAYVARYCLKKVTGEAADNHYKQVDLVTGEIIQMVPEFAHMSLKPGIGRPWLDKYSADVYPHDYVIIRGQKVRPPKYYDTVFEKGNIDDFDWIRVQREMDAETHMADNSWARLAVKEEVKRASISMLRRS